MPIYEYKCRKCGKEFEIEQRITEDPLTICPDENCKGEIFRKISKNVGLVFKGSGFYLTDYVKKNGSKASSTPVNGNGHTSTEEKKSTPTNGEAKKETPKAKEKATTDSTA
jgi:putative FmdB family regulatory protein